MIAAILLLVALAAPQTLPLYETPDLQGKLYKSVFVPGAGALTVADLPKLPEPARGRLERYLARRAAFKSQMKGGATTMADVAIEAKRRRLEGAIVALIDAPEIDRLAAEYAQGAKVVADWERSPMGPLLEAEYAEDSLKQNPSSPLAPFLYVFIAQRQRAAFEAMTPDKQKDAMSAAAKKYRTFMQRARAAEDPIFTLLADDIDRQASVHVGSAHHPRDFNPDT